METDFSRPTPASNQLSGRKEERRPADGKTMRELAGLNLKAITHIEPERIDFTAEGLMIRKQ